MSQFPEIDKLNESARVARDKCEDKLRATLPPGTKVKTDIPFRRWSDPRSAGDAPETPALSAILNGRAAQCRGVYPVAAVHGA